MIGAPATPEAYNLFHKGLIALAQVEETGICVDVDYLDRKIAFAEKKAKLLEKELKQGDIWKLMQKRYGQKANLSSREQVAEILFKELGHECKEWTEGKVDKATGERVRRPKADATTLRDTGHPDVEKYLAREKLIKDKNTFLSGLRREVHNGRIHTFFNLAGGTSSDDKGDPRTYRSSSDSPNLHNQPTRDGESADLVRSAFIPDEEDTEPHVIIEADFKGIEVSIAYCYHKDPVMRKYLLDPSTDMHRDVAIQSFMLEDIKECNKEWWKSKTGGHSVRYSAKNKFTFPQFYGDYWRQCAKNLWDDIRRLKLCTPDGSSMYDHLEAQGIASLGKSEGRDDPMEGTFEYHIREVERDFWGNRFRVYNQWKKDWFEKYLKRGYFRMKTGFVCTGLYNKKQVVNYPVQGAAFHCLLWCLIELQKWLNKNKMKTKIVSQIHDSLLLDGPVSEVKIVVKKLKQIMRELLPAAWDWINIPLEVEVEIAQKNWYSKISYEEWEAQAV